MRSRTTTLKEESNVTYQPKRDMVLSLGERLSTKQVILVLTIIQHLLLSRVLSHDENSGKLVVVPRNGGFSANDIIVGGTETTAGMRLEDTMDTFVTEDTGDKILIDVQLELRHL